MRFRPRSTAEGSCGSTPGNNRWRRTLATVTACSAAAAPWPGDVEQEGGERAGIEQLVTEDVAAEAFARHVHPIRQHRAAGDRLRQDRPDITGGGFEFALDQFGGGHFVRATAMIAERVGTDGDCVTVAERHWRLASIRAPLT